MIETHAVCHLSDEARDARRRDLRNRLVPQIRRHETLPDGLALSFDATPALRAELDAFVAFENECCPSVGFRVRQTPDSLCLEISGEGAALFAGLVAEDRGPQVSRAAEPRGWSRLARRTGLGAVGAFVLFCAVPMGLVALLGAQWAAPLSVLENPWVMAAGTVLFAGLLWRWERRRQATRRSAGDCGC